MSPKQLLVTRPQPQADEWAQALRTLGVSALPLPLIEIVAQAEPAAVEAWTTIDSFVLLVFVSPNAAASFFLLKPAGATWPRGCLAGSTGPGTTRALRAAGVPPEAIVEPPPDAAQFDSEALWHRLRDREWQGRRVLVVRGDGGRDWLAETLRAKGAEVRFVQAYRRAVPRLDAAQRALLDAAAASPQGTLWLFSSSQAVAHLRTLAPQAHWAAAHALATHPRIAEAARALGFGTVLPVAPSVDAVKAAWARSLQSSAPPDQRP